MNYFGLCIGGGGIKGIILAGALEEFNRRKLLLNVTHLSGSSAGALICYLFAIGYSPIEMLSVFCDPFFVGFFNSINPLNIGTLQGFYPLSILHDKMKSMTFDKLKTNRLTFLDLAKLGKHLYITGYCLSEKDPEKRKIIFSEETFPDMFIYEAVALSCSMPIVFEKSKYKDKVYIDGMYCSVLPTEVLIRCIPDQKILALYLDNSEFDVDSLSGYLMELFSISLREQKILLNDNVSLVTLQDKTNEKSINLSLDIKSKLNLFTMGTKMAQEILGTSVSLSFSSVEQALLKTKKD
jgi:predicted acylesterase/phospholipase RssA